MTPEQEKEIEAWFFSHKVNPLGTLKGLISKFISEAKEQKL